MAITPAAGFVTPSAAIAIGVLGAAASFFAMQRASRTQLDDALDVFACHGVAGIMGALLTGVFATKGVNAGGGDGLARRQSASAGRAGDRDTRHYRSCGGRHGRAAHA